MKVSHCEAFVQVTPVINIVLILSILSGVCPPPLCWGLPPQLSGAALLLSAVEGDPIKMLPLQSQGSSMGCFDYVKGAPIGMLPLHSWGSPMGSFDYVMGAS